MKKTAATLALAGLATIAPTAVADYPSSGFVPADARWSLETQAHGEMDRMSVASGIARPKARPTCGEFPERGVSGTLLCQVRVYGRRGPAVVRVSMNAAGRVVRVKNYPRIRSARRATLARAASTQLRGWLNWRSVRAGRSAPSTALPSCRRIRRSHVFRCRAIRAGVGTTNHTVFLRKAGKRLSKVR